MSRLLVLSMMLFLIQGSALGQPPAAINLKHYVVADKKLGTINCYVTDKGIDKEKPLLLYLDGSGDRPLFRFKIDSARKSNIMYSTITFNYDSLAALYHVVFISKPGVKFADSVFVSSLDSNVETNTPAEYTTRLSAGWRAEAASAVLDFLPGVLKVDARKVVVMGYSEGSQVAPHVAVLNKKVTHVVLFSGNGINQLYDFIIQERLRAGRGEISHEEAQINIDELMSTFSNIFKHPLSTDSFWAGHTYLRWSSFCNTDPMDYMLQLKIPIYLAMGTADENTQVLSTDYLALEFLRRGKNNLIYKSYPSCNHFFQKIIKNAPPEDHLDEVTNEMFEWLNKQ